MSAPVPVLAVLSVFLVACGAAHAAPGRAARKDAAAPVRVGDAAWTRTAHALLGAALADGQTHARLVELVDGVGARLSGSAGGRAAEAWAQARLRADGVPVVRLEPVKVPHWVRGEERGEVLAGPGLAGHPLHLTALGGSGATPPAGLEADVVQVDSLDALRALGEGAVRGKVVLFQHDMKEAKDYGQAAGLRSRGPALAQRLGAVAALVRSAATASLRTPHTGSTVFEPGQPALPAAALAVEDALLLRRALARGPVRVRLVLTPRTLPDADAHNVVAEVRGRERPDEVVVLGAHLDSWDTGPGAHDDGAGVAMVMEAAALIARLPVPPRRTVRFVLFANEENGLRGGRAYAEAHAGELARHVAALESDSGGGAPLGVVLRAGPGGDALVRPLLAPLEAVGAGQLLPGEAGGADLSPMAPARVPFAGVRVDASRYFDVHHTAADTLDKVDPLALARSAAAFTYLTWALAEMPDALPRPEAPPAAASPAAKP